jgi:hypothetical protein
MSLAQLRTAVSVCLLSFLGVWSLQAQEGVDHSYKPLTVKLDETGSKYIRFITWHQVWAQTNNLSVDNAKLQVTPLMRRSRFLAYAQVSPRFLILTHFGLNNLTPAGLPALGNQDGDDEAQLFLHDAWTEFKVTRSDALYIGGGLHYWKGLSRLSSASTLNFMTLDQPRPFAHWHSLGITDLFARHLGVYAKGAIGKMDYRIAVNSPGRNPLAGGASYSGNTLLSYTGVQQPDKAGEPTGNTIVEGYVRYNFLDKESIVLPYNVGSYLGSKKIFAVGAGFFAHPNGMYDISTAEHSNVFHFAADAFLDYPTAKGDVIHAYGSFTNFNYGSNYVSRWAGTGTVLYGQFGYMLKPLKLMPYVAVQSANYQGFPDPILGLDVGLNYFVLGHNAKLTLEYHRLTNDTRDAPSGELSQVRLQAHIFL